ncbi:MAG: aminotransferase class I/II-fold pyridoxal phosphate-dependent enzyme [bacterium]
MDDRLAALVSRRDVLKWGAALGSAGLLSRSLLGPPPSEAFPADPFFAGVCRMVYHENPWGPHPAAVEAIREVLAKGLAGAGINRYDDYLQNDLKHAILRHNGLEGSLTAENVILGVGSSEVLFMAADAFTSPERPLLTEWITYRIILQRAGQNGAEVIRVPLRGDWEPDLDRMLDAAQEAAESGKPIGLVHFNLINNPAGTFLERDRFDAFARRLYEVSPETVLLCDDSDREYMDADKQPLLFGPARHVAEGRRMLHVQTFSHIFGLTGLRVGYGLAPAEVVRAMEARKIFAGVNVAGHQAALASLANADEQIRRCHRACTESRAWLDTALSALGLEHLPSQGHYILINLGSMDGTIAVLRMFFVQKVFIRWGSEWGMDNWIRVNPGTEWENERFIEALRWVLDTGSAGLSAREYLDTTEGKRLAAAAVERGFPPRAIARALAPVPAPRPPL